MKKQVFSLVMVLALVVLAGTSAFAQGDGTAASPVTHVTGSTHTFTVTNVGGNTYAWSVLDDDGSRTATDVSEYSISGAATNQCSVTWTDAAGGSYIISVTETGSTSCTTTRDFYVDVFSFDVLVYTSSNSDGSTEETDLSQCGDNNDAAGYIFDNVHAGAAVSAEDPDGDGTLDNVIGTIGTTRYLAFDIDFDGSLDADPVFASVGFDYTVTATYADGSTNAISDLQSLNAVASASSTTFVNTAANTFAVPVVWNDRWGPAQNIRYTIVVTNVRLYELEGGAAAVGQVTLGEEKSTNELANGNRVADGDAADENTIDEVTIEAAPETTAITVN